MCVHEMNGLRRVHWYVHCVCVLQVLLLFDNGATVFFAIFMSFWGEQCHTELSTTCYMHVLVLVHVH